MTATQTAARTAMHTAADRRAEIGRRAKLCKGSVSLAEIVEADREFFAAMRTAAAADDAAE